jgi:hypothetical protein
MDTLMAQIREGMARGRLPCVDCAATWYGPGRGQRCAVCDHRILGSELGIDCDIPDGTTLRLHARCYEVWHSLLAT